MAAMMSMFAGMNTTKRSSSHPGHHNPLADILSGGGSGARGTTSSVRDTGRNTESTVMATTGGNKANYDIAMSGAVDEITTCVGSTASVGKVVNNQGDATRKMVPAKERLEQSDSVRDSASIAQSSALIPQSSALIQQSIAMIANNSAGTTVTHHRSASAPLNGASNTANLDDSASVIQSKASMPQSSAGTKVTHKNSANAALNGAPNTSNLDDSAVTPSTRVTSCAHCTQKQTHDLCALQETCKQYVSEAETRIVTVLSKRITDAERRTQETLDAILRHVKQLSSPQNGMVEGGYISLD